MKKVLLVCFAIVGISFFVYGTYWIAKTVSYTIFYEDMVQETIKEMVRPEYLK